MSDASVKSVNNVVSKIPGKITCQISGCGAQVHRIESHIAEAHDDWTLARYRTEYPDAPTISKDLLEAHQKAHQKKIEEFKKVNDSAKITSTGKGSEMTVTNKRTWSKKAMKDVFDLGTAKAALNARGEPIMISVCDIEDNNLVPDIDPNYVFDIDLLKNAIIGFELGMPTLAWGLHGTGKTTLFEQIAARTGRPFMRVQHTVNTEESHIVGQYIVKDGATVFQLGPLPVAMMEGDVYCADEYDFAMPSVLSVYQPVLEGKPLVIKDAPLEMRVIRPHPNFRFVATGNTNGGGDETGLYQGTQMQNAANYSRFNITVEVNYMDPKIEVAVIAGQAGIEKKDADALVRFAKEVRDSFKNGRLATTISPRELITAAKLGLVKGSDWRNGLRLAFINRLSRTDKEVVEQFAQRMFAGS